MPYENELGHRLDSGDFERVLNAALLDADHGGFVARREASARHGRLRGIGIGYYVNVCAENRRSRPWSGSMRMTPSGLS